MSIVAINKPKGPTSHDIIDEVRKITAEKRVGHAGTLDPLASGVLVVAIGRESTKQLQYIVKKEKEYIAKVCLGAESTTDDAEGKKISHKIEKRPKRAEIKHVLEQFIGKIQQIPPKYSAIKINGIRGYKAARQGLVMDLRAREVEIKRIEILDYKWPNLKINVVTGPGVYIRGLARDIGKKLEIGGFLVDLKRTRVGDFDLKTALTLAQLKRKYSKKLSLS